MSAFLLLPCLVIVEIVTVIGSMFYPLFKELKQDKIDNFVASEQNASNQKQDANFVSVHNFQHLLSAISIIFL